MSTEHETNSLTLFGFWVYLMTDFILFATLFAAYAVLQGSAPAARLFSPSYALIETLVLLTSSFSCALGLLFVHHKPRMLAGFSIAFLLGLLFLALVGHEFASLIRQGITWQTNAFFSSYFTLIGVHALHIFFGLLFMALFVIQALRRLHPAQIRRLTCLSLFWFFSYLVWVFMFTIVYLKGAA